ncbi:uncharacterized protein F5147DRAFT_690912 [Suillus discolor]|uniref:Uncharacterized protein n=1 Tax=Suillus discolor TaxID=1912936 RepID=A0A9P7JV06_9AGAM|nr:uncharacterized protein F5147DRAFT_690912 [Suillus discolor]KAG2109932.1 hypothetical protein F5147DRAFT_690912 [Suillus discolor]
MHLSSLAVMAALTASVYISTTLATSNDTCLAVGKYCDEDSQCCSDACTWKSDCTEKYCVAIDNILDLEELRRAYISQLENDCTFRCILDMHRMYCNTFRPSLYPSFILRLIV